MTIINKIMNWKKINLYILLSFGISWSVALIMKFTNIEFGSVTSIIMIGGLYMQGPAIATFLIQKLIYKEGFKHYGWAFDKKAIKWFFFTPLVFLSIILLTFLVVGLLGNTNLISQFGHLDFSQESLNIQLKEILSSNHIKEILSSKNTDINTIKLPDIPGGLLFILFILYGMFAGLTINLPFMFGEEFGWRGLLLRETRKLGFLKANVFIGIIWGLWHLPIVLMGLNYPNHPYFGIIMMCFFTTGLAPIFAYVRLKTKSILGACMLHGMINAIPSLFGLYIANGNELYSSIAGWAGVIACIILTTCIYIFDKQFVINYSTAE